MSTSRQSTSGAAKGARRAAGEAPEAGLKIRDEDLVDEQGHRLKSLIAGLAMTVELQKQRFRRLENAGPPACGRFHRGHTSQRHASDSRSPPPRVLPPAF